MTDLVEGAVVDGRYKVEGIIGRGSMGTVYAARHVPLDQPVAIKTITKGVLDDAEARARFSREARVLAKLSTRHAPRVLDVGELDDGQYMAQERLTGEDLAARLATGRSLTIDEAMTIAVEVLDALAEAHSLGIVHRDIKPANVFLAEVPGEGRVAKVLDFGISKASEVQGGSLTGTHEMMGSPGYMAPEQILATSEVDPRADLWSWGAMFYEMLVGAPPFPGDVVGVVLAAVLEGPIVPVSSRRPVPDSIARIVHRCLERDLAKRYASAGDIAADLAELAPAKLAHLLVRITRLSELHGASPGTVRNPALAAAEISPPTVRDPRGPSSSQATLVAGPAHEVVSPSPALSDPPPSKVAAAVEPARSSGAPWVAVVALVLVALVLGYFVGARR